MTAEIGRVLGGRYRLVAPIGMGASAQVYLADDVRLRRRVALKMLHDALAGDAEFIRRFRAEARAAAALSHPNVMAVFDWGDDDAAFIVTEYLSGGSLRALLDTGGSLTPSQALMVGLEAARALDYAHRRGFVHRDIKPANLLFGEEQRLRIADFGLARALAEAAWTEPQGAVLGTARYSSPEQAKGEKLTGKADVYSLALVLVEAVTGEVPFVADTTLGTLMARIDKAIPVPESLGALRPVLLRAGHPDPEQRIDARALAAGLLRAAKALSKPAPLALAGALPPAGGFLADADPTVHAGALAEPAPAPDLTAEDLDLDPPHWVNQREPGSRGGAAAGAVAGAVVGAEAAEVAEPEGPVDGADPLDADPSFADADAAADAEADLVADPVADAAVGVSGPAPDTVVEPAVDPVLGHVPDGPLDLAGPAWSDEPDRVPDPVDRVVDGSARPILIPAPAPPPRPVAPPSILDPPLDADAGADGGDGRRPRRRWPWALAVLVLLLGGGGVAAVAMAGDDGGPSTPALVLPVPTLVGRTQQEAAAVVAAAGWKVRTAAIRRNGTTKGQVLASEPEPGHRLRRGATISLTVSAGQEITPVPTDLAGRTFDEAKVVLVTAGFEPVQAGHRFDEEVAKGSVLGLADGTKPELERGSRVGLVVSDGPEPRTVPGGLVGGTAASAKAALAALQLKMATVGTFSDTIPEGQVISVLPASGSKVERDSTVSVEVSKGPELVAVPSIKGADSLSEAIAILRAAGLRPGDVSGSAEGKPKRTSPGAGTKVKKGSSVDIIMG
jgi:beta-lactam-binding protein with PASTA domain/tRNA A-37 threonylcarbamoyl transferase component Bud32